MLPLLDRDYVDYNVDMVALFALGARPEPAERFDAYRKALVRLQPRPVPYGPESPRHLLHFDVDEPVARGSLEMLFDGRGAVEGSGISSNEEVREISRLVREAERFLEAYSASAAGVLRLLIGSILFARLPVEDVLGSSHGALLGTIWINPMPGWTGADYAEMILHEGVHQSLFLDEKVNTLFTRPPREMETDDCLVLSPSLATPRPYDLAYHSTVVVTALHDFYAALGLPRPPRVEGNLGRMPEALAGLRKRADLLTDHGERILRFLEEEFRRLREAAVPDLAT